MGSLVFGNVARVPHLLAEGCGAKFLAAFFFFTVGDETPVNVESLLSNEKEG